MSKPNDARRVSPGRWIAALLVAGAVQTGSAHARVDEPVRLSVSDALSRAVSAHPELDAQAAEIEAREGEARQAGLWSNPSIELEKARAARCADVIWKIIRAPSFGRLGKRAS